MTNEEIRKGRDLKERNSPDDGGAGSWAGAAPAPLVATPGATTMGAMTTVAVVRVAVITEGGMPGVAVESVGLKESTMTTPEAFSGSQLAVSSDTRGAISRG